MVLLIDNYDSFSYNLYQVIGTLQPDIRVIRNDELTVEEIEELAPSHIVLSPGPGKPKDAGICEAYGATITYADRLMHGKQSEITIESETKLFRGMERQIKVARYHSLVAEKNTIPEELRVTAVTKEGEIMAVAHKNMTYTAYSFTRNPF